jgi:hypothetical protein
VFARGAAAYTLHFHAGMRAHLCIALILSACASATPPLPNAEVRASQAAISRAEQAGARDDARAARYLARARDQLHEADRAVIVGDYEAAASLLRMAQGNAELATSLAREGAARAEAVEMRRQADAMQRRQP